MAHEVKKPMTGKNGTSSKEEEDKIPQKNEGDTGEKHSPYYNPFIKQSLLRLYDDDTDSFYMRRIL